MAKLPAKAVYLRGVHYNIFIIIITIYKQAPKIYLHFIKICNST